MKLISVYDHAQYRIVPQMCRVVFGLSVCVPVSKISCVNENVSHCSGDRVG